MSNVQLAIGGRGYTVACADGEEAHVAQLGRIIDGMVTSGGLKAQSEQRMLLYAALMLADELDEARRALAQVPQPDPSLGARVEGIADRLEALTRNLEDLPS